MTLATTNTPYAPCTENVKVISWRQPPTEVTWGIRYNGNVVFQKGWRQNTFAIRRINEYTAKIYGDSWDGAYLSILGESVDGSPRGVYWLVGQA